MDIQDKIKHYETRIATLKELGLTSLQRKWEWELKKIKEEYRIDGFENKSDSQ